MDKKSVLMTVVVVSLVSLLVGAARGGVISTSYQVSAGVDDGYAWSAAGQDISSSYLVIGDGQDYSTPYHISAMRFAGVDIPRSAAILEAHLRIRSIDEETGGQIYGVIEAEAADDVEDFSSRYIGSAAKTAAAINWDQDSGWQKNTLYTSGDISSVIAEVVDRGGWSKGNSLAVYYSTRADSDKSRMFSSFELGAAYGAVLEITYETYTISGYILEGEGAGLGGVTVSAGGDIEGAVTDGDGYYELEVPAGWSGMVTPSKADWGFIPVSRSYSSVTSDRLNQNYTAFQPKISGYIRDGQGVGIEGVLVTADNGGGSDTTGSDGYYEVTVVYGWSGVVTPSKVDWVFSPVSRSYSNLTSDRFSQNYWGLRPRISGYIRDGEGVGVEGVLVTADNGGGSDSTGSDGYYEITVVYGWSGIVTPSKYGWKFIPESRGYSNVTSDLANENYTTPCSPWAGSGDANDPYQIWTAADMQAIGDSPRSWGSNFRLMADIDLGGYSGTSYNIIGREVFGGTSYIALAPLGKIYWTDRYLDKICRARIDGTGVEDIVTTGLSEPSGIALDIAGGKMYWTDWGTDKICRANLDGTGVEDLVTTGLDIPQGIALDTVGGKMYWTDIGTDKIQRANLDGTGVEDLVTGLISACYIALDTVGGKMYWTDYGAGKIQRANLDGTNALTLLATQYPFGIALDIEGGKMYWARNIYDRICRANLNGTGLENLIVTGIEMPRGIALDASGGKIYWTDYSFDFDRYKICNANFDGTEMYDILIEGLFRGIFDGNGHTISNFTYDCNGINYTGLFGHIDDPNAEVKNLGLIAPDVNAGDGRYVGSLVGRLESGSVTNCYVEDGGISGLERIGGLIGWNNQGGISECYCSTTVFGNRYVGGLAGWNETGEISDCDSDASVSGQDSYVGGLVGWNEGGEIFDCNSTASVSGQDSSVGGMVGWNKGYIFDCNSSATVVGDYYVGGLVGRNYYGEVISCYSTGSVTGEISGVGGLVGYNNYGDIEMCYSTGEVTGGGSVGGLVGSNQREGYITNSYSTGNVTGGNGVGGLVGYGSSDSDISNCYSTGSVSGVDSVGGLIGKNYGSISSCYSLGSVIGDNYVGGLIGHNSRGVYNCYSACSVTGESSVGGLIGYNHGAIYYCYSTGSVSGTAEVGGLAGYSALAAVSSYWDIETSGIDYSATGIGLTTAQLQSLSTFTESGWGCDGEWAIDDGNNYPCLLWEDSGGEPIDAQLSDFISGTGSESEPFEIYTAEELNLIGIFRSELDKHFELMADIDLFVYTGQTFNIIGAYPSYGGIAFTGVFDGGGHTVSNLRYESEEGIGKGLFGYIGGWSAEVRDVGLIDPNLSTETGVIGSLVGCLYGGTVNRCYVEGGSVQGSSSVGGLVGWSYEGEIQNCYAMVTVTGDYSTGGLLGMGYDCLISKCYSAGKVTGGGGLVGGEYHYGIGVLDSYWDVNTSEADTSSGGIGLTTKDMQSVSTYMFWGCEGNWTIDDGNDYPRLAWEGKFGEVIDLGCGTEEDPYLIYKASNMQVIGEDKLNWDKHYKLMADIDMSAYTGNSFNIIGTDYYNPFTGVFDGNGHTISNFTYDSNGTDYIGLFGYIDDPNAEIKNLGLIDPNVSAGDGDRVGGLAGSLYGTILNCYVKGCSVSGTGYVGGLVGSVWLGTISNSYSEGSVSGDYRRIGGLVGASRGNITNSYSSSIVTGYESVGGLAGISSYGAIMDCYSTGEVTGEENVGGLVGSGGSGIFTSCFWDSDVNPDVNGIGNLDDPNVVGLPTVLMQTMSTFTDAGWDFVDEVINGPNDIWDICEGTNYPKLVWSIPAGDFICPDGVNMLDFAILGDAWFTDPNMGNWDPACDISEPNDNFIDGSDLEVFAGNWLEGL